MTRHALWTGLLAAVLLFACARKDKEKPSATSSQAQVHDVTGLLHGRTLAPDAGSGTVTVTARLLRSDGGVDVTGAALSIAEASPEGVHVLLGLQSADGGLLHGEWQARACVTSAQAGVPVLVPVDAAMEARHRHMLAQVTGLQVLRATKASGCLRPTLRVETMAQPKEGSGSASTRSGQD